MNRKQIKYFTVAALSVMSSAAFAAMTATAPTAAPTFARPGAGVPAVRPSEVAPPTFSKGVGSNANVVYPNAFNRVQEAQGTAKAANDNKAAEQRTCPSESQMYSDLTKGTRTAPGRLETLVQARVVQVAANDCGQAIINYSVPARDVFFTAGECMYNLPKVEGPKGYIKAAAGCMADAKNDILGTKTATPETEEKTVKEVSAKCHLFPMVETAMAALNDNTKAAVAN